jgi:ectoine hydroxylase-related dioxygenase (phytanoyl-CoA dioxygenase family)
MSNFSKESELQIALNVDGFAIIEGVLSRLAVAELIAGLDRLSEHKEVRRRGGVFAVRNLLDQVPEVRQLASSEIVRPLVQAVLGEDFFPVRGILFDKIPEANWKVPWHQDVTIAVQERVESSGFGPWSMKADVLHVQPPASILENMVSVRIHIDDCLRENGALRVIPGSHLYGRIAEDRISDYVEKSIEQTCEVRAGGVLIMRPLLLHASSPSTDPKHRRVVHLDFASVQLPSPMRWLSEPLARPA